MALERLQRRYELAFVPSPWFAFYSRDRPTVQYCQPDGLLFVEEEAKVVICEIKYQHVADAYFQLRGKYVPVVQSAFPGLHVATCEIVKWFDPQTNFPCAVSMQPDPSRMHVEDFGVHILNR